MNLPKLKYYILPFLFIILSNNIYGGIIIIDEQRWLDYKDSYYKLDYSLEEPDEIQSVLDKLDSKSKGTLSQKTTTRKIAQGYKVMGSQSRLSTSLKQIFCASSEVYLCLLDGQLPEKYSCGLSAIFSAFGATSREAVMHCSNMDVELRQIVFEVASQQETDEDELGDLFQAIESDNAQLGLYTIITETAAAELYNYLRSCNLHTVIDVFAGSGLVAERMRTLGAEVFTCDITPPSHYFGFVEASDANDFLESKHEKINTQAVLLLSAPAPELTNKEGEKILFNKYLKELLEKWITLGGKDIILWSDILNIDSKLLDIFQQLGLKYKDISNWLPVFRTEAYPFASIFWHISCKSFLDYLLWFR